MPVPPEAAAFRDDPPSSAAAGASGDRPPPAARCYYHPDHDGAALCARCGRALCARAARPRADALYCPECDPDDATPLFICGCCGRIGAAALPACSLCGATGAAVPRFGAFEAPYWERRFRGHDEEACALAALAGAALPFVAALAAGSPLPIMGVAPSPYWWAFVLGISLASSLVASRIARRARAYQLVLSSEGVALAGRGELALPADCAVPWRDVTGLRIALQRRGDRYRPDHILLRAGGRTVTLDRTLAPWNEAVTLIRQHAAVAPSPSRGWEGAAGSAPASGEGTDHE